jgi:endonuclease G, mitochondrial
MRTTIETEKEGLIMAAKKKAVRTKRGTKKSRKKKTPKQTASASLLEQMRVHVRAHGEQYLQDPNVTSVGVGYKQVKGERHAELSIQFTVDQKVTPQELGGLDTKPIPKTITLQSGAVVPTDVIERSFKPSYLMVKSTAKDPRKMRADKVQPGMSIGISRGSGAGTVGTFVTDSKSARIVLLSNWHVLHTAKGTLGDDIAQPGPYDDNQVKKNRIGELLRSHLGVAGDCAIASVDARTFGNTQFDMSNSVLELGEAQLDDRVVKSGRTTAVTYGVVIRLDVLTKITYPGNVTATVGGFEIGPDEKHPAPENEISRAGDSGSAWMAVDGNDKPTNVMLGLHFAGDDDNTVSEVAVACGAGAVFKKLEIEPLTAAVETVSATQQALAEEAELQTGFDKNFLRFAVPAPGFTPTTHTDLATLDDAVEIAYCHFSVWLSRNHMMPICVAWNVDGSKLKKTNRLNFRMDRRGDLADYQIDNDLYVDNPLDRGHIARRADLSWGDTLEEAKKGNYDSFYYTNICPQHERFNQSEQFKGKWGMLENAIFDDVKLDGVRVSLFGGPIFRDSDRPFSQNDWTVHIPEEFFKIVAYTDLADNKDKVKAFRLSQAKFIKTLLRPETLELGEWIWAQVSLESLEKDTGIRFAKAVRQLEVPFVASQALGAPSVRLILAAEDFFA